MKVYGCTPVQVSASHLAGVLYISAVRWVGVYNSTTAFDSASRIDLRALYIELSNTYLKMKQWLALIAILAVAMALPQRRIGARPDTQPLLEQPQDQAYNDQGQNYNDQSQNYNQQSYNSAPQQRPRAENEQEFRKNLLESTTWIPILRFDKEQGTDGSYKTAYETGNNIIAEETGFLKSVGENQDALVQQGSYSYTSPDGQVINVEYTADELGFRVKGDHIPTPPPVSAEIQKGLDLIYAGIKANQEKAEIEARNNPEAAKAQESKQALDYKGIYYQQ